MELLFLGTSSGVPTKSRNVSAVALKESSGSHWYLIDCGEGTQHQLLNCALSANNLNGLFITHVHGDHCYGLPGLLATIGMNGRTKPLKIFSPKGIEQWLEATRDMTQWYLPYTLEFIKTEALTDFELGQFKISSTKLSHRVPSYAYSFTQSVIETKLDTQKLIAEGIPAGPIWGQLKQQAFVMFEGRTLNSTEYMESTEPARKIIIAGDNDNPSLLAQACENAHVLVHESTYDKSLSEKARKVGHSYAALVAQFAEDIGLPNLVLTHFSARFQSRSSDECNSINVLWDEAKAVYSKQLFLAEDFQSYKLDKQGKLILIGEK